LHDEPRPFSVEQAILPHLDAAYNLARWLTTTDQDAEDVLQEACLRAIKFLPGYEGGSGRAWLLTIVRRTDYTWLAKNRGHYATTTSFDEELHSKRGKTSAYDPIRKRLYVAVPRQEGKDGPEIWVYQSRP
jgi:RNA polymerase sigma-70 factor, ECF subfamily